MITSLTNPEIKKIRSLSTRKYREEFGLFTLEGEAYLKAAIDAGWQIETLVMVEGASPLPAKTTITVPQKLMANIQNKDNPQPMMGVLAQKFIPITELQNGVWVALEQIRDPGNLGTIMRTAVATGAKGIILLGECCDAYSPEAIRASVGSFVHLDIIVCSTAEFITQSRAAKLNVIGTHLDAAIDYRKADYTKPLVLTMGNEQQGLSETLTAHCTQLIKIPMSDKVESLNVATATALVLYQNMTAI